MKYSTTQVCQMTGASYRQLDYWARTGRIPDMKQGGGSGSRREWTDAQIARVQVLLEASRFVGSLDEAVAELERRAVG